MATIPRWFCLGLTLWMVGLRPAAATRTGSIATSPWWGTKEAQQINRTAERLRGAGNFPAAESLYQKGYQRALRLHDRLASIRMLSSIGAARLEDRRYRAALPPLLEARKLAKSSGALLELGAVDGNLSSLYLQVWDVDSALAMAEEGLEVIAPLTNVYYRHHLLLQVGKLHQALQDGKAAIYFQKGIEAAREAAIPRRRPGDGICWAKNGCGPGNFAIPNARWTRRFGFGSAGIQPILRFPMDAWER